MILEGRTWVFQDHVDTDAIVPGKYLYLDMDQMAKHALEILNPAFPSGVRPGDILVAGRNFGCGSSREQAPRVLRNLGVSAILAESFARIFFRNSIALGLPAIQVPNIRAFVRPQDTLRIDLGRGEIENLSTNQKTSSLPIPERLLEVLQDGGVLPALKRIARERAAKPA